MKKGPSSYNDPHCLVPMGVLFQTMSVLMAESTHSQHSLARSKDALPRTVAAGVWDAQHCQGAVVPDLGNVLDFSFEN